MRVCGADGRANVGISNDKAGEKPARRKTKDSCGDVNQLRVSRELRRSREVKLMRNRLIFRYQL